MTQTALITGSTGFIGSVLARTLCSSGYAVRCMVRPTSNRGPLEGLPVDFIVGDMTRADDLVRAVDGVDVVFHLAALLKTPWSKNFEENNVLGARFVAQACARQGNSPTLILMSSMAASGPGKNHIGRAENAPCEPVSRYGRAKRNAEIEVVKHAQDVPITIIRPPGVFGAGDDSFLRLFRSIERGWHVLPTRTDFSFSMVHVRDLVQATIQAYENGERAEADSPKPGQGVYHVAHPERLTYAELGARLSDILNQERLRTVRLPKAVTWLSAGLSQAKAQLSKSTAIWNLDKYREATGGSWWTDCAKAQRELSFVPWGTLNEQLTDTAHWYREHGQLQQSDSAT